jgi:tetratricopeptide (TPR) repeat protein
LSDGLKAPAEPNRVRQFQAMDLRAQALRDLHRSSEALAAYRDELTLAQRLGDISAQGTVMAQIAFVERQMGLFKDGDDTSIAGLKLLGPNGPPRPRADLLDNRALVAVAEGRAADAIPFFEASLALRRSEAVTAPLSIAADERDLAAALASIGRNIEAGQHMDAAIELFQALGPGRTAYLSVALDRRVSIAIAAGDLVRAESALRALLPLRDPTSDAAADVRLALAGVMDDQARRKEATALRDEAMSIVIAKDGVDSPQALRIGLNQQAALRASGRLRQAAAAARDCADRAASMPDVLLSCQLAQTETALDGGNLRDAAAFADMAVIEAETHWTHNTAPLLQALMLRIRVAAAMGDTDTVLGLYDRVHGLTPEKGSRRGWTDVGEGRMLIQSGAPDIGLNLTRQALRQANSLHDIGLAVAATGALAHHDLDTGKGREAITLWAAVLPLMSDDAPEHRVTGGPVVRRSGVAQPHRAGGRIADLSAIGGRLGRGFGPIRRTRPGGAGIGIARWRFQSGCAT